MQQLGPAPQPLADLVGDEEVRRREFPVSRHRAFFAHAAVAPLPRLVVERVTAYAKRAAEEGQFGALHADVLAQTRALAARLLDAGDDEIAFVTSTSMALSMVAAGIDWRQGDNVLIPEDDFPANLHPWLGLRQRGVAVRFLPHEVNRGIGVADVAARLDSRTRLVSLSTVHYLTGHPADVEGIGGLLRERGVLFCLDAIQSLGVMPCSARHADFVAAGAHKWLLGPQGIGLLVVNRRRLEDLRPILLGWKSVGDPGGAGQAAAYLPGAQRFEPGTLNILGVVGLHAALTILGGIGPAAIADRVLWLRRRFAAGLEHLGYDVLGRPRGDERTGITSFCHRDRDLGQVRERLERRPHPIVVSERHDRAGLKVLRFAPHFYNTEAEVDALLDMLA